jgi:predicted DCC family thiol-disulfide oxidoreductase YuxK
VQRRVGTGVVSFIPNDTDAIRSATALVNPELAQRTIVVLDYDQRIITGAQAIFTIISESRGMLSLFATCLKPRPVSLLFEPGYRLFAKYRGQLARFFPDTE